MYAKTIRDYNSYIDGIDITSVDELKMFFESRRIDISEDFTSYAEAFKDVVLNPEFTDEDFDENNPEYGFIKGIRE